MLAIHGQTSVPSFRWRQAGVVGLVSYESLNRYGVLPRTGSRRYRIGMRVDELGEENLLGSLDDALAAARVHLGMPADGGSAAAGAAERRGYASTPVSSARRTSSARWLIPSFCISRVR